MKFTIMEVGKMKDRIDNGVKKAVGRVKEAAGEFLDDPELEFEGKMQSMKADIGSKVEDMKDTVLDKTNDLMDRMKNKRNK